MSTPANTVAIAIDALADLHDNLDTISRGSAIRAASEGRAAFWSTATYHNQAARNLLDEANDLGVYKAIQLRVEATGIEGQRRPDILIATLIPLNALAAAELDGARKGITNLYVEF